MAATFVSTTAYSLAEMKQFYDDDMKLSTLIDLLSQDNPIMEHAMWKMGNQTNGHKGKITTELPDTDFRRLYQGTPYSKSGVASVTEPCRQISTRWGVDIDEMKMYEGEANQNAFRFQEGRNHVESMQQFAAEQVFYGNPNGDADEVRGLASHMPYDDGPNTINGGSAETSGCTSIFGVVWGDVEFHGIYPKNMKAGLQHEDLGKYDAYDASGNPYRAIGDEWKWNLGFFLADWRCAVRICNIEIADLTILNPADADYIDLRSLTIQAKNKIPYGKRGRLKWYCSESVMNALELQAGIHTGSAVAGTGNVHLRYGEWQNSSEVLFMHGKPVFQCDAISENESALPAM